MDAEQRQAIEDARAALLQLLEPNANGDAAASIAVSLKRIADTLAETTPKTPPRIVHR
jgi:hypothetical protein